MSYSMSPRGSMAGLGATDGKTWLEILAELTKPPVVLTAADPKLAGQNLVSTVSGSGTVDVSDYESSHGFCRPKNFTALTAAKELQQQLNRVAKKKGFATVGVDGDIGLGTLNLHRSVQAASGGSIMGDTSQCIYIAGDSDVLSQQVKQFADSIGAPPPSPSEVAKSIGTGMITTAKGDNVKPPGATPGAGDYWKAIPTSQRVAIGGMVAAIGIIIVKKRSKGRKGGRR